MSSKTSLKLSPKISLMTHIVAGYPNFATNKKVIQTMIKNGVSYVEIQFPFSDPMADGSTIVRANQGALDNGTTTKQCFELIQSLPKEQLPILIMTYYNLLYRYGIEKFFKKSVSMGVKGLIIPDIPFDEKRENFYTLFQQYDLMPVPVISPGIEKKRLQKIIKIVTEKKSFIYVTLKVGITGASNNISEQGFNFLKQLKKNYPKLKIAVGFGISKKQQIEILKDYADIFIIGSKIINVVEKSGVKGLDTFLKELKIY